MYNHKWEFGTPFSKAKWHNKAKDTLYNFKPELDEDVKTTSNSPNLVISVQLQFLFPKTHINYHNY